MNAWLSARRIKKGQEEAFRKKWKGGDTPEGMLDAYLLEDEEDPRETLSISFWDTARDLLAYRTGEEAKKRKDDLGEVVDKDRWSRAFVAFNAVDIESGGGGKKWLVLPLLLVGVGAGIYYFLSKRGGGDDEWDTWEPEPAGTFRPIEGDGTAHDPTGRAMGSQPASLQTGAQGGMAATGTLAPQAMAARTGAASTAPAMTQSQRSPATASQARGTVQGRSVREIMTANPETVGQMASVVEAARMMRELDVGVLPVLADGHLAGMVTDRDIAVAFAERDAEPDQVRVMDVMTELPRTIGPDDSVDYAAQVMAEAQIRRLPVMDGERLVGIVSLGDLAVEGAQQAAGAALTEISEPAAPDR